MLSRVRIYHRVQSSADPVAYVSLFTAFALLYGMAHGTRPDYHDIDEDVEDDDR